MTRWTSTLTLGGCKKTTKRHSTRKRINLGQRASLRHRTEAKVCVSGALRHIYPAANNPNKAAQRRYVRELLIGGLREEHVCRGLWLAGTNFPREVLNVWFGHRVGEGVGWILLFFSFWFVRVSECFEPWVAWLLSVLYRWCVNGFFIKVDDKIFLWYLQMTRIIKKRKERLLSVTQRKIFRFLWKVSDKNQGTLPSRMYVGVKQNPDILNNIFVGCMCNVSCALSTPREEILH